LPAKLACEAKEMDVEYPDAGPREYGKPGVQRIRVGKASGSHGRETRQVATHVTHVF